MQRAVKFSVVCIASIIVAMLWFWLVFGNRRFACAGADRSFFIAGVTQFAVLAIVWGCLIAGLLTFRRKTALPVVLWAVALGSAFDTIHRALGVLDIGIGLSASALVAIAFTQGPTLIYLRRLRLIQREFDRALSGVAIVAGAGLLSVLATTLWLGTVACGLDLGSRPAPIPLLTSSPAWYIACGAIPAFITALIYASETQPQS
jgi:hypothetical protein